MKGSPWPFRRESHHAGELGGTGISETGADFTLVLPIKLTESRCALPYRPCRFGDGSGGGVIGIIRPKDSRACPSSGSIPPMCLNPSMVRGKRKVAMEAPPFLAQEAGVPGLLRMPLLRTLG